MLHKISRLRRRLNGIGEKTDEQSVQHNVRLLHNTLDKFQINALSKKLPLTDALNRIDKDIKNIEVDICYKERREEIKDEKFEVDINNLLLENRGED